MTTNNGARFTVDRDALNAALAKLWKFGCGRGDWNLDALYGVHIRANADTGKVELTGFADGRLVAIDVPGDVATAGALLTRLEPLKALVAKMKGDGDNGRVSFTAQAERPLSVTWDRLRLSLSPMKADDFPVMATDAPAFTLHAAAVDVAGWFADAAARAGCKADSKGVRFAIGAEGLDIAAASSGAISSRRVALPRLSANGLNFRPRTGAPIVAAFHANAAKRFGMMLPDVGAVALGFHVVDGIVAAITVDLDGARVRVPTMDLGLFPDWERFADAAAVDWFATDADELAHAVTVAAKGGTCKVAVGDDSATLAGETEIAVAVTPAATAGECEPFGLNKAMAATLKGGGRVAVAQCGAGDGRAFLRLDFADGLRCYVVATAENPADRFARQYGAAYAARDGAAMRAAVATCRAVGPGYDGVVPDVWGAAAHARGMTPKRAAAKRYRLASDLHRSRYYRGGFTTFTRACEMLADKLRMTRDLPGFDPAHTGPTMFAVLKDGTGAWIPTNIAAIPDHVYLFEVRRNGDRLPTSKHRAIPRDKIVAVSAKRPSKAAIAAIDAAYHGIAAVAAAEPVADVGDVIVADAAAFRTDYAERHAEAAEAPQAPLSIAADVPPSTVAEADELTDAPASPAPAYAFPAIPSPLSPFNRPAVDDGPGDDLAAAVAALLARVAALEAATVPPTPPVTGRTAAYAKPGAPGRAAWEATLAYRAGGDVPRAVDDEAARLRGELAAMTAERDALQAECAWLHAARDRTAARLAAARREAWSAKAAADRAWVMIHQSNDIADVARNERDDARATLATSLGEVSRLRKFAPLAGIQWSGGHSGAVVTPKAPTRVLAPAPRLIIADGRRVAA